MRTKSTGGFTLIELLIVIAIIGILAAVLIPNLMNARTQAQIRASQAHNSSVVTAVTAALAEDVTLVPSAFTGTCAAADYGNYEPAAQPAYTTTCGIVGVDADGSITVTSDLSNGGQVVNGVYTAP